MKLINGVVKGVNELSEDITFDASNIIERVKNGEIELCFYYGNDDMVVKHAYMYRTLKSVKSKYSISFATWTRFHRDTIHIDGDSNNLNMLCIKTKKWSSDLNDRNAIETILDFMWKARVFVAKDREITLSHVVLNGIEKAIYIIPIKS